ncbi:50S ribosomal protein L35 [bacterium]|nr:MAG: 50S ribosomal protein L35 [bacterium]
MPKMKTRKGASKRFKKTGNGKIIANHAGKIHFKRRKSARNKRNLRHDVVLSPGDAKKVRRMIVKF